MKRHLFLPAALLLLAAVRFAHADAVKDVTKVPIVDTPSYAKVALVVGVSDYEYVRKLTSSTRDAQAFYDLLVHQFKFDPDSITFLTDEPGTPEKQRPSLAHLKHAVNMFLKRVEPNSEVVFFYSGHGVRQGDEDYLVPSDAELDDIASNCVSYDKLKRQLETKTPRRALLITDACRSLSPTKGAPGTGFGLGNASDLPQIAELFSCQAAQESWEGAEFQQGVFTHFLLAGLKGDPDASTLDGLVTFDSLQQYVRGKVKAYTAAHFDSVQEPIGKSTLGSMVLAREQGEVVVKPVDALAHIHVTSEPPGAKVYVDGQVVGITPCTLDQDLGHLKTKQVEITVEARDYKSVVRTASMERGGTAEIDCPLERTVIPVVPIAHLNVVTNPPGARVFAGDQEIAGKITPCVIDFNMATQLQWQGIVTVVLGDLKASQEVSLEPNKTTELNLALQRPLPKPVIPATPTGGGTRVNPKDGAEMVFVPAGHFLMGEVDIEQNPCRTVTLDAFWIYKNDVTVAQYRKFCQATGRQMPQPPGWGWKDDHPVVNVTLENAEAYCRWAGMALPTKAQWEKAARGTDGRRYPWGNEWDPGKLCCSVGQHRGSTAPVGSYPAGASPYGCMDMAGNVWQWCADWYGNPASRQDYVLRGGSWNYNFEIFFRCGSRGVTGPVSRDGGPGFRCAVRADLN